MCDFNSNGMVAAINTLTLLAVIKYNMAFLSESE